MRLATKSVLLALELASEAKTRCRERVHTRQLVETSMRKLILASVLTFGLVPFVHAQTLTASGAGGTASAGQGSVAASAGNGAALSGGIQDSQVASFDVSGAVGGMGLHVVGTGGATDVQSSGLEASTSTGTAFGAAAGGSHGSGAFGGIAASLHH